MKASGNQLTLIQAAFDARTRLKADPELLCHENKVRYVKIELVVWL